MSTQSLENKDLNDDQTFGRDEVARKGDSLIIQTDLVSTNRPRSHRDRFTNRTDRDLVRDPAPQKELPCQRQPIVTERDGSHLIETLKNQDQGVEIQKQKDPDTQVISDSGFEGVCGRYQSERRVSGTTRWCRRLAWTLCLLLSLCCLLLSAVLGTRCRII